MKKEALFDLIGSLSAGEKKYFRLSSTHPGKSTRYLELFDAIESGRARNDKELRSQFSAGSEESQFHVLKNYLAESLLKRLRELNAEGSPTARILSLLGEVEILFDKELFDLCLERLRKAETLAVRHECLALLCEIASWKRALALSHPEQGLMEAVDLETKTLSDLKAVNRYWGLSAIMAADPVGATDLVGLALRRRPDRLEPDKATVLRHHLTYAHHLMRGQVTQAETGLESLIAFMESRPDRIAEDPGSYATALSNLIALRLQERRWEGIADLFAKIPRLADGTAARKFSRRTRLRLYNLELEYYRDRGLPAEARALMGEIVDYLETPGARFPNDYRILFHYQFACLHYMDGDRKEALRWINAILSEEYGGNRTELQAHARLLSLALHYELGNLTVLRYAVDGYRRYLKKNGMLDAPAIRILRLFANIGAAVPKKHGEIFSKAREHLSRDPEARTFKKWADYFDWPAWLTKQAP
ncbi:MAG: hypothetical protein K0Q91_579 [Fibrobacteria bacterium]|jgi:hypothetical protein|nr:hypothetical protein [Fibrobacteria bacterium]